MIAGVEGSQDVCRMIRIPRHRVEVNHTVARATRENPVVDGLALLLFVFVIVALERATFERVLEGRQRGTDNSDTVHASSCDELLIASNDIVGGGSRFAR